MEKIYFQKSFDLIFFFFIFKTMKAWQSVSRFCCFCFVYFSVCISSSFWWIVICESVSVWYIVLLYVSVLFIVMFVFLLLSVWWIVICLFVTLFSFFCVCSMNSYVSSSIIFKVLLSACLLRCYLSFVFLFVWWIVMFLLVSVCCIVTFLLSVCCIVISIFCVCFSHFEMLLS